MKLTAIDFEKKDGHVSLIGHIACRTSPQRIVPWAINEALFEQRCTTTGVEIFFEFPRRFEDFISPSADPFAVLLLLPSMAAGEPLEIIPPISEQLLFNLATIRDIFHSWYPLLFARVPILASPRHAISEKANRAASFFSGGVDSFYTLLKRHHIEPLPVPLSHIIFMQGIEQRLEDSSAAAASERRAAQIASTLGIECIAGRTNLRTVFPLHWDCYYVGSGLAATAIALSRGFSFACIPSPYPYTAPVVPAITNSTGSTPLVDERFSTEAIRIVHDGSEVGRAEKTRRILEWDQELVLANLRVCFENEAGTENCGRCYKCVRTAVALKILGVFDEATTFPDKTTGHWGKVLDGDYPVFTEENLALALELRSEPELTRLLDRIVRKHKRHEGLALYIKNSPLRRLLPIYRYFRD